MLIRMVPAYGPYPTSIFVEPYMTEKTLFAVSSHEESEALMEFFRRAVTSMKLHGLSEAKLRFALEANIPDIRISFIEEGKDG